MIKEAWSELSQTARALWANPSGDTLVQFLLADAFVWLWCAAISLYFLVCIGWLVRTSLPVWRSLKRASRRLQPLRGQTDFARGFDAYDSWVKEQQPLAHAWSEFVESLILPTSGTDESVIRNPAEPAHFINDATIIASNISLRFFHSVPAHLTAAGILGTFLGLAAGIHSAKTNLIGTPDEVLSALQGLLSGASLAFMTSIFGIFFSLLFLVFERFSISRVHRSQERWIAELDKRMRLVTPEQIALDQLDEARRQTKQLERFNDQLVFALEQALEEKVTAKLAPHLQSLIEAVEKLREERSTDSVQAIENLVGEFTRNLTDKTGSEFDKVASTVGQLDDTLKQSVQAMARTQQDIGETLTRMLSELSVSLSAGSATMQSELANAMNEVTDTILKAAIELSEQMRGSGNAAAQQITGSFATFERGVGQLERSSEANAKMLTSVETVLGKLHDVGATLQRTDQQLKGTLEPLRNTVGSLQSSSERIGAALRDTSSLVNQIAGAARSLETTQEKTAKAWDEYRQRFEGIDLSLSKTFEQMDEGLVRYTEQVRRFANELDQQSSKALQTLAAATGELEGVVSDLLDGLGRVKRA